MLLWQTSLDLDPCFSVFLSSHFLKRLKNKESCLINQIIPMAMEGFQRMTDEMGEERGRWPGSNPPPDDFWHPNMPACLLLSWPEAMWCSATWLRAYPGFPWTSRAKNQLLRAPWRLSHLNRRTPSFSVFLLSATLLGFPNFVSPFSAYSSLPLHSSSIVCVFLLFTISTQFFLFLSVLSVLGPPLPLQLLIFFYSFVTQNPCPWASQSRLITLHSPWLYRSQKQSFSGKYLWNLRLLLWVWGIRTRLRCSKGKENSDLIHLFFNELPPPISTFILFHFGIKNLSSHPVPRFTRSPLQVFYQGHSLLNAL